MARFYGAVGYMTYDTSVAGVSKEQITERSYYGDVVRNIGRWETGTGINDDLNINNQISIVADAYAYQNLRYIRYVTWMGTKWKVTSVEVQRPRLILSIGGEYNG